MFRMLKQTFRIIRWGKFRLKFGTCTMCGRTIFVKLDDNAMAIRCIRCKGSLTAMAIASVLTKLHPEWYRKKISELSSRGAFFNFLNKHVAEFSFSEYFNDIAPGAYKGTVQCQDVQELTYGDNSFDICTCTEVFEHVPDDIKGFHEIYRVIKPGGLFLFTVPLSNHTRTIERASLDDEGKLIYIEKPEYHDDLIRGPGSVLCFRNYGVDIVERLEMAGFKKVVIMSSQDVTGWGFIVPVIVAYKS